MSRPALRVLTLLLLLVGGLFGAARSALAQTPCAMPCCAVASMPDCAEPAPKAILKIVAARTSGIDCGCSLQAPASEPAIPAAVKAAPVLDLLPPVAPLRVDRASPVPLSLPALLADRAASEGLPPGGGGERGPPCA